MKKLYSLIAAVALSAVSLTASAQDEFSELIKSSPADATKLLSAYGDPLFKGFGIGLNSGWNNTAATKKFLHFDLRITANVAMVPTSERTFDVTKLGLSNSLSVKAGSPNIAQTFGGSEDAINPVMEIKDKAGTKVGEFELPGGISRYVPAPNVQFTVGLVHNTDVTLRITPEVKISDDAGKVSMFGIGFKHNIIQTLAKKGTIKPFDLAVAVNYNQIKYTKGLEVRPDAGDTPAPGQSPADFSTQEISATFRGVNVQAIISKRLLFFTPFASVGYQTASTKLGVMGNFPLQSTDVGQGSNYVVVKDPINIDKNSISGIRGDVGFQMNLAILRIYASVGSGSGYVSGNAGIGLGF